MKKKNLIVSVSGGETSLDMAIWLYKNKQEEYNMLFAFANTSKERPETLEFLNKCDNKYNLNIVWIEAVFSMQYGKGTDYRITDFYKCKRQGEVFEEMILNFGIPNIKYPHCTRELKSIPLKKLADKTFGVNNYEIAIGYRPDEIDRCASDWKEKRHYYPQVYRNMTKPKINISWQERPFRLELKGYEGNCDLCFKKSLRKHLTLLKELKSNYSWWGKMEVEFSNYIPKHRQKKRKPKDNELTFFRNNLSYNDLLELSKQKFKPTYDDSIIYDYQDTLFSYNLDLSNGCTESCEPF